MKIDDYFNSVERGIRQNPHVSRIEEPTYLSSDDYNGLLRCRVIFWDESFLDIFEVVSTELGYPIRISYAYTYIKGDQHIFRYDNAPHHPDLISFPHHKHTGVAEKPAPADQPSLNQVFAEINGWLESKDA